MPDSIDTSTVLLWPAGAPEAVGKEEADKPYLEVYKPVAGNGTAVVICPGGGYSHLAVGHEGEQVARWLNARGIAAFVLHYRIAPRYRHPAPMLDAQRAVRIVRTRAGEWDVDPNHIGIWGFSAGGHLASTVGTHFGPTGLDSAEPIECASCRPDFMILCYPLISFTESWTHAGARSNLLGDNPDPELAQALSNEKQVTAETPPTFLFHTDADPVVPVENSIAFYTALRNAGVPAELHVYEKGPHGVGLAPDDPVLATWPERLEDWLRGRGVL